MASADFDTQDFDLNDIAFDSTIAVSDHDWKEDHSNLDGFFVFGFTNQNTGQPFCHAFPLNGMGSNWDYNHFYEYEAASYDFYYYDRQRIPQYTDVYPDYFPEDDIGVFSKFILHIMDTMYQEQGIQVSLINIYYGATYDQLKWRAQNWLGCTDLPDTEDQLDVFPLLDQQDRILDARSNDDSSTENEDVTKTKIKRTNVADSKLGLSVVLFPDERNYRGIIKNNYRGFRALVHGPLDFAEVAGKGFPIGKAEEVFVGIRPEYLESSDDVKSMPLDQRQCLTAGEDLSQHSDLNYQVFAKYNRKACLLECQANRIMKLCNCLPYYYPRFDLVWKNNTACDFEGLKCLAEYGDKAKALHVNGSGFLDGSSCNCPSDCDSTTYYTQVSRTNSISFNKMMSKMREDERTIIRNLTLTLKRYG